MANIQLQIISPDKAPIKLEANYVVLSTTTGEMGILPDHIPFLVELLPGSIEVQFQGASYFYAIDKGYARMLGNQISILTEAAIDVKNIDLSMVEEAEKRALQTLEQVKNDPAALDPEEINRLTAVARFAFIQKIAKTKQ